MRTFSTILSLIFFISFARFAKSTSYSEIVYNVVDITENTEIINAINQIHNGFIESKIKLTAYDDQLLQKCNWAMRSGQMKTQEMTLKIRDLKNSIADLENQKNQVNESINQAVEKIKSNAEEIEGIKVNIETENEHLSYEENEIGVRANVFRRLLNLVEDELVAEKRTTEMNKFNVDKDFSGKTSFVELERIRNDLLKISNNSKNSMTKSMITSLLMITESSKKALFSDPEIVGRVKNSINNLVSLEKEHLQQVRNSHGSKVADYKNLIAEKVNESEGLNESLLKNKAEVESKNFEVENLNIEISGLEKSIDRAVRKNQVQVDLCNKQQQLSDKHQETFMNLEFHYNELANNSFPQ